MVEKNNYKYTVDLTRLINSRIEDKKKIAELGNQIFNLKLDVGKIQKRKAITEKDIDKMVIEYGKK